MTRTTIGKYVDLQQLGHGGMAEVYSGIDPTLNRKVAIKLILPQHANKEGFEARFQREARTIANLRHGNVVQIYEYAIEDGAPYMVMEYLDGGTLEDVLAAYAAHGQTMPLDEVAAILDRLASGLDYAHQRGLIHRDIKPSNILFSDSGEPIIADFGIVKLLDEGAALTRTGGVVGSPRYIPPEQATGEKIDQRSDQYSLGIVLYQMVTGKVPFEGDLMRLMYQHIHTIPTDPRIFKPDLQPGVARVILRSLEKNPDQRYPSVGDLARAFRAALAESPASAMPESPASNLVADSVPDFQTQTIRAQPISASIPEPASMQQPSAETQPRPAKAPRSSSKKRSILPILGVLVALIAVVGIGAYLLLGGLLGGTGAPTQAVAPPTKAAVAPSEAPSVEQDTPTEQPPADTPVPSDAPTGSPTEAPAAPTHGVVPPGNGTITYTSEGRVYRIAAQEGAAVEDVSAGLDGLAPGGGDALLNISPDSGWLVLQTERFDPECVGWPCLAVVSADLTSGDVVRADGAVIHPEGIAAIASGGDLVVYSSDEGPHTIDLWAVRREDGVWGTPIVLTTFSSFEYNNQPAISDDGSKVVFNCGILQYGGEGTSICQVGTDGNGLSTVLNPAATEGDTPIRGAFHQPDFAPDGSLVFEGDWVSERIWRYSTSNLGAITEAFSNDNSPCVLPDGRIVSLWLDRPGGSGLHEFKVMTADGSDYFMILTGMDVVDAGIGCGQ